MDKEEILRRAQMEGNGEYEDHVQLQILRRSVLVILGLCAVFWLARASRAWMAGEAQAKQQVTGNASIPLPLSRKAFEKQREAKQIEAEHRAIRR